MTYQELQAAAALIAERTGRATHQAALVLGSGLSDFAATLPGAIEIPYEDLPGFPVPRVTGHAGSLYSAEVGDGAALVFAGRVHYYEGWPLEKVVAGVRTAVMAGAGIVVLTNAAGGVNPDFAPGDLVLISDHLNLTASNPLMGTNDDRLGTRFPDLTDLYSSDLRTLTKGVGDECGVELKEGIYAWLTGPSYESPAEIQMVSRMGGDLVGMSTVPEAIAVRHMGAKVMGISLCTNLAAGISATPLSHDEVKEVAGLAHDKFTRLLHELLPRLVAAA
ncbi:MAG: purine-nucleoside phosphorylase [Acidimicrobiia bacterium]|nr:purine-nucleoside phosphorylase [Acidimicrobiia bacterium]MBT8193941.1 purine-nucleoside phosphorylase [Acidimicrobiia bacterium]NNF89051.1 purine-nucleoside phosphorylase [Acidimicrobiia bacterium]NNL69706.1 purine-nucleoside phosphorylase [Acidimicrobiia bacterium]RZV46289.1 MAG: purine-nucleoside phosphorylase [Acidimicrobiia bacterium]